MMPFLMVSATRAPTRTAPVNSQQAAAKTACLIERDRDETEVANELATCRAERRQLQSSVASPTLLLTSLAPMLNASRAAKMVCGSELVND